MIQTEIGGAVQVKAEPKKYALDHDIIAVLEKKILAFEDHIEDLNSRKTAIENSIRRDVEVLAEDKDNKLTNETKRQIKYTQIAEENEELQKIFGEIKIYRREVKKLGIEVRNEQRAYHLIVGGGEL